jgi:hypothetical protein
MLSAKHMLIGALVLSAVAGLGTSARADPYRDYGRYGGYYDYGRGDRYDYRCDDRRGSYRDERIYDRGYHDGRYDSRYDYRYDRGRYDYRRDDCDDYRYRRDSRSSDIVKGAIIGAVVGAVLGR